MPTIERVNRQTFKHIREAMDAALAKVGEELGLSLTTGRGSFDRGEQFGSIKVEIKTLNKDGTENTEEAAAFSMSAGFSKINPDALGKTFTIRGKTFTIKGWKSRARKRPVLVVCDDGKDYVFDTDTIRSFFPSKE